jgi:hypothetical protein
LRRDPPPAVEQVVEMGVALADRSERYECAVVVVPKHAFNDEVHAGPAGADAVTGSRNARQRDVGDEVSRACAVVVREAQSNSDPALASALATD